MFSTTTTLFSLALLASPILGAVHQISVGATGLVYDPPAIFADVGDQVVFTFAQKNHTVTQSSFANPCSPADGGFNSGFKPVTAGADLPTVTYTVQENKPLWFYCAQGAGTANSHCGAGMVFAINCGGDGSANSLDKFKASAQAAAASMAAAAPAASSTGYGSSYPGTGSGSNAYPGGGSGSNAYPGGSSGSGTTEYAAYGTYTVPAAPTPSTVTRTITLESKTWTTTYASYPNSPDPTPASLQGNLITVEVGASGLTFSPPHVVAKPFDTIMFVFKAKNHTVTQSAFADPCRPLAQDANGQPGFDSGFMPVGTDGILPTWNLTVNTTAPMWAYCRQNGHCGAGMVFAINSDESSQRSFAAFQGVAKELNSTSNLAASVSASAPKSASSSYSGAASVRVASAGVFGAVVFVFAVLF